MPEHRALPPTCQSQSEANYVREQGGNVLPCGRNEFLIGMGSANEFNVSVASGRSRLMIPTFDPRAPWSASLLIAALFVSCSSMSVIS